MQVLFMAKMYNRKKINNSLINRKKARKPDKMFKVEVEEKR